MPRLDYKWCGWCWSRTFLPSWIDRALPSYCSSISKYVNRLEPCCFMSTEASKAWYYRGRIVHDRMPDWLQMQLTGCDWLRSVHFNDAFTETWMMTAWARSFHVEQSLRFSALLDTMARRSTSKSELSGTSCMISQTEIQSNTGGWPRGPKVHFCLSNTSHSYEEQDIRRIFPSENLWVEYRSLMLLQVKHIILLSFRWKYSLSS